MVKKSKRTKKRSRKRAAPKAARTIDLGHLGPAHSWNKTKLGKAAGLLWGGAMLVTGIAAMHWGYGQAFIDLMGSVYPGANAASWMGVLSGTFWGLVDGYVGGWLLAWLYNKV